MRYLLTFVTFLLLLAAPVSQAQGPRPPFTLSRMNGQIIEEFQKAWRLSGDGTSDVEGVVLIFLNPDGSYRAVTLPQTNESRKVTFRWDPRIIAIVHTHPTRAIAEPHGGDIPLADRFGVPIFTLTLKGMFMYDPQTKKISKVKDRLDWSKPSSWARPDYVASKQTSKEER